MVDFRHKRKRYKRVFGEGTVGITARCIQGIEYQGLLIDAIVQVFIGIGDRF